MIGKIWHKERKHFASVLMISKAFVKSSGCFPELEQNPREHVVHSSTWWLHYLDQSCADKYMRPGWNEARACELCSLKQWWLIYQSLCHQIIELTLSGTVSCFASIVKSFSFYCHILKNKCFPHTGSPIMESIKEILHYDYYF